MKKINLEKKVMGKIKSEEVRMKNRYWFTAKEWSLKSFVGLATVGMGLLLFAIGYTIDRQSMMELWEFGDLGREIFISDFPYFLLIGSGVLAVVAMMGLGRIGDNYKKTKLWLAGVTLGAAGIITGLIYGMERLIGH